MGAGARFAGQLTISNEAKAVASENRLLSEAPAEFHGRGNRPVRGLRPGHVFEKRHDIGGGEEMHADHILGAGRRIGNLIDAECGRVGS